MIPRRHNDYEQYEYRLTFSAQLFRVIVTRLKGRLRIRETDMAK